ELDVVEGVPHEEARRRYARADIVVDQLNAGWHGVFALEAMALGKPVVTYLKPDVVERSAKGYGVRIPIVPATKETLVDALRPLVESAELRREIVTAATAVLAIVLQLGIASAFFRFYFDAKEPRDKLTVVRTSFWFTMTTATLGLVL